MVVTGFEASFTYICQPCCCLFFFLPILRCLAALSLRPLGFILLNPNLNHNLINEIDFPSLAFSLLLLELPLCSFFPTPNFCAFPKL